MKFTFDGAGGVDGTVYSLESFFQHDNFSPQISNRDGQGNIIEWTEGNQYYRYGSGFTASTTYQLGSSNDNYFRWFDSVRQATICGVSLCNPLLPRRSKELFKFPAGGDAALDAWLNLRIGAATFMKYTVTFEQVSPGLGCGYGCSSYPGGVATGYEYNVRGAGVTTPVQLAVGFAGIRHKTNKIDLLSVDDLKTALVAGQWQEYYCVKLVKAYLENKLNYDSFSLFIVPNDFPVTFGQTAGVGGMMGFLRSVLDTTRKVNITGWVQIGNDEFFYEDFQPTGVPMRDWVQQGVMPLGTITYHSIFCDVPEVGTGQLAVDPDQFELPENFRPAYGLAAATA